MNRFKPFMQRAVPRAGRRLALLALLAGLPLAARAQQVLVQANVADDTLKTTFGPNRRWFGHGYLAVGLVAGPAAAGAPLRYGPASAEARAGGRLKLRLSQPLALCADLAYAYQRYELAQEPGKVVPTPALHQRETLALHLLSTELGLRLNYGRRGNVVGRYLDLLAGGHWVAGSSHTTRELPPAGIATLEVTERGLGYVCRFGASAGARLGFDRYALVGRYRLSPVFAGPGAAWPGLPRWVLGLEVGVF